MKNLPPRHFKRTLELADLYHREAHRCAGVRAYYAACAASGAALEAMLLSMCSLYLDEVDSIVTQRRLKVPRSLDKWNLGHMLMIAREMRWLPGRSSPRALQKVGDWAGVLKDVRNFVHPGAHLREFPTGRLRAADFHMMDEILEGAIGWLRHRIEANLLAAISKPKAGRAKVTRR